MLTRVEEQAAMLPCGNSGGEPIVCCTVFSEEIVRETAALLQNVDSSLREIVREKRAVSLLAGALACSMAGSSRQISHRADGSPFIADRPELCVSISHCGRAAAAVISDQPIGIDMERIVPLRETVLRRVFSEREREYVLSFSDEQERNAAFCRIWTTKEAAIKAAEGLSLGDVFRIEACPTESNACLLPSGGTMQTCSVQWNGYAVTLCARQAIDVPKIMTLAEEQQTAICHMVKEQMT